MRLKQYYLCASKMFLHWVKLDYIFPSVYDTKGDKFVCANNLLGSRPEKFSKRWVTVAPEKTNCTNRQTMDCNRTDMQTNSKKAIYYENNFFA